MLKSVSHGSTPEVTCDRFSTFGQEISFLEDNHFIDSFNHVLAEVSQKIKDPNLHKIFWRAHIATSLVSQCYKHGEDRFQYIECGTHLGIITRFILTYHKNLRIRCHLFDTWNGIPEEQILQNEPLGHWHNRNNYTEDTFEYMAAIFKRYPSVIMIRGRVPDTLHQYTDEKVNFLHLDMNITYPEKKALEYFWPKIEKGGCVLLDDYGFARHTEQRTMYDAFFGHLGIQPCQLPTGQAFVFKN